MTATSRARPGEAETVAAIRGQIDLDAVVVEGQPGAKVLAERGIGRAAAGCRRRISARPSSLAEQIMPKDSTPRSLARLILKSPGRQAPMVATGTFMPSATLAAPQMIWSGSSWPRSTRADPQLGGVRMGRDALNQTDDDATEGRRRRFDGVHLQTRHAELIGQLLGVDRRIHPLAQPSLTESHVPLSYVPVSTRLYRLRPY